MKTILWSLKRLVNAICDRLLNQFDVFMVIEGNRGLGKSTLGYKLMVLVRREMQRREVKGYKFIPRNDLIYSRKEVLKFFHKWQHSGMADEMINVTFNRDFYNEDQKDIIKMINMNRDHNNFFVACVPHFKTLDSQIKNLCSMKISILRRGVAIIQTPNKTIYSPDIWDERINEKIERDWLKGGIKKPRYSRLTTYRGFVNFPKLTEKQEATYQKIKDDKRNIIAKENNLEDIDEEKEKDPFNIIYKALIKGSIKNTAMLDGMLLAHDLNVDTTKQKLRKQLKRDNKSTKIITYYHDSEEAKVVLKKERQKNELDELIAKVRENSK